MKAQQPAPRPIRRLIERVCKKDREYFERHPEATFYERPYVSDENWPYVFPEATRVRVTALGPGLRVRQPLTAEGTSADPGYIAITSQMINDNFDPRPWVLDAVPEAPEWFSKLVRP